MAVIDDYVAARKARDFKAADEIRGKLRVEGIVLEVKRDGTVRQRGLRRKEREAAAVRAGATQRAERPSVEGNGRVEPIVRPGAS